MPPRCQLSLSLCSDHLPRAAPVTLGPCLLPAVPPSPQPPTDLCTALLFSAPVSQGCYKRPAEHGNRWMSPLGLSQRSLGEKHKTWRAGPHQDSLPHVCPPTYFCLHSWEPMTAAESKAGPPATSSEPSSPHRLGPCSIWLLSLFLPEAPSLQPTSALKSLHFPTQRGLEEPPQDPRSPSGSTLSSLGVR